MDDIGTENEEPKTGTPLWNRRVFWIAVGLLLVIVMLYAIFTSGGNSTATPATMQELPQMVGGC